MINHCLKYTGCFKAYQIAVLGHIFSHSPLALIKVEKLFSCINISTLSLLRGQKAVQGREDHQAAHRREDYELLIERGIIKLLIEKRINTLLVSDEKIIKLLIERRIIKLLIEHRIIKLLSERRIIKLLSERRIIKLLSHGRIIKLYSSLCQLEFVGSLFIPRNQFSTCEGLRIPFGLFSSLLTTEYSNQTLHCAVFY